MFVYDTWLYIYLCSRFCGQRYDGFIWSIISYCMFKIRKLWSLVYRTHRDFKSSLRRKIGASYTHKNIQYAICENNKCLESHLVIGVLCPEAAVPTGIRPHTCSESCLAMGPACVRMAALSSGTHSSPGSRDSSLRTASRKAISSNTLSLVDHGRPSSTRSTWSGEMAWLRAEDVLCYSLHLAAVHPPPTCLSHLTPHDLSR